MNAQKAADRPIHQHQGIWQPQQAGVHQLIGLIYTEQKAKAFFLRERVAVADGSADGAPGKFRNGEKGIHGGSEARRRAEKGDEQGRIARGHAVGNGHVRIEPVQAVLLPQIGGCFPDIPPPCFQRQQRLLIPAAFLHANATFQEGRQYRKSGLYQQQPSHAQLIVQHRRQRHHQNLQNGIEHG